MSFWGDLKSIVADAAPIVGTVLGGPIGGLIGGGIGGMIGQGAKFKGISGFLPGAIGGGLGAMAGGGLSNLFGSMGSLGSAVPTATLNAMSPEALAATSTLAGMGAGPLSAVNPMLTSTTAGLLGSTEGALGGNMLAPAATTGVGSSFLDSLFGGPTQAIGTIGHLGQGIYDLYKADQMQAANKLALAAADPFGPYRAGYAAQLANLEANPSSITSLPGYQAGLDAVQRSMAAQGYMGSGNMMAALAKYGQNVYNQQVNTLANLGGAGITPAAAAQAAQIQNQMGIDATQLTGTGMGAIGKSLMGVNWGNVF